MGIQDNKNIIAIRDNPVNYMPPSSLLEKNQTLESVKELFDPKKIEKITDLTPDEIRLITRMWLIADMKGLDIWKKGLDYYMSLMLSANRKSRKELINVLAGIKENKSFGQKLKEVFKPTE
jgi:hypothetical protein